jgi:plastocyanin
MLGAVLAAVVVALVVVLPRWTAAPPRDVVLVTRDMAFYLEGDRINANPVIEAKAGERLRIVLRNEDRGIAHDFALPALDVDIDLLKWNERGEVTLTMPNEPGRYEYVCRPHLLMMKGALTVVAP